MIFIPLKHCDPAESVRAIMTQLSALDYIDQPMLEIASVFVAQQYGATEKEQMSVRSKQLVISNADGAKSLGELMGVSEPWTRVFLTPSNASTSLGDSTLSTTEGRGLVLQQNTPKELQFQPTDNPADELFVLNVSPSPANLLILAW
jgi:hypothetical protein